MYEDKKNKITSMLWPWQLREQVDQLLSDVADITGQKVTRTEFCLESMRYYLDYLAKKETDKAIASVLTDIRNKK